MPADRRDDEPLGDALRAHVEALRIVDAPGERARANNWAAVAARTSTPPARRSATPWIAAAVAIAAAIVVVWSLRADRIVPTRDDGPSLEAPYGHVADETEGDAKLGRAAMSPDGAERSASPPAPDHLEPGPVAPLPAPETRRVPEPTPPRAARPRGPKARPPTPEPSSLAAEIAAFRAVQEALVDRRFGDALAAVDAYDAAYPRGTFAAEGRVARVSALCELGRKDEARRRRDAFLERHPRSHLAPRMREACPDER